MKAVIQRVAEAQVSVEGEVVARKRCMFQAACSKFTGGQLLVVSQFTLMANLDKGNRPSFDTAAGHEAAEKLYRPFRSPNDHIASQ